MSRFANKFTINEIVSQAATQIPWFTLIEIMTKSKHHNEILWYVDQTHKNNWSRSMVLNQFRLKAYERSLIEPETSPVISSSTELTNELFKDTYVFDFIDINNIKTEKELYCKEVIKKHSKDFNDTLEDPDVIKLCGCSKNSHYKYKRDLKIN